MICCKMFSKKIEEDRGRAALNYIARHVFFIILRKLASSETDMCTGAANVRP